MKCAQCPLYSYWNNESDKGEACGLFGDGWDSPFQYEDKKSGAIVGCYIDRHYIEQSDRRYLEYLQQITSTWFDEEEHELGMDTDILRP